MDQANTASREDGTQRDVGSEGHRLPYRVHRAGDSAREVTAECRQRVRRCVPTAQCRP